MYCSRIHKPVIQDLLIFFTAASWYSLEIKTKIMSTGKSYIISNSTTLDTQPQKIFLEILHTSSDHGNIFFVLSQNHLKIAVWIMVAPLVEALCIFPGKVYNKLNKINYVGVSKGFLFPPPSLCAAPPLTQPSIIYPTPPPPASTYLAPTRS